MEIRFEIKNAGCYRVLNTFFHLIGAVHFGLAVYYYFHFKHKTEVTYYDRFGWSFKYLVFWSALISAAYFTFAWIIDITKYRLYTREAPPWMMHVQAYFRSSVVVPITFSSSTFFWILFFFNPHHVFKESHKMPNMWIIHMVTTNTIVFVIVDTIICKCDYPNVSSSALVIFLYFGSYFVWMCIVKLVTDVWIVPLFGKMSFVKKIVTFFCFYLVLLVFYLAGRMLNQIFWDESFNKEVRNQSTEGDTLKRALSVEPLNVQIRKK